MTMFKQLPLDGSVQAEYEDGFILDETEHDDVAQFGDGNIFRDIYRCRPEAVHGKLVRFTLFWKNNAYNIDWRMLPRSARPIRFRNMSHTWSADGSGDVDELIINFIDFGYQYNDENGKNVQEVQHLM